MCPPVSSRRRFLSSAAGLLILPSARMAFGFAASERLNLGVVGVAGYGAFHGFAEALHRYPNVGWAYSCDVDGRKVAKVYELWDKRAKDWPGSVKEEERRGAEVYARLSEKRPALFGDFRKMLDEAGKEIDAVVVATPDHTHAVISAAALRAGKPVFCEKPLTISAHEARALARLAGETKLPTQMNNHGAQHGPFRRGIELIREGTIGAVREVHVFYTKGGRDFQAPPRGAQEVPKELDWNLWLAQVRWREYHAEWINRIGWRETSIGELGNFAPHTMNLAFMALNVRDRWRAEDGKKIRVTAECSSANQLSYPKWERIVWEVPERGEMPPVKFTWHHGPPPDCAPGSLKTIEELVSDHGASEQQTQALLAVGCLIVGSAGVILSNSHNTEITLLSRKKFEGVDVRAPKKIKPSPGHYKEWVEACRDRSIEPICNFSVAAPFAEMLNVGSVATRFPGEAIEFDPVSGRITNHEKAAGLLQYEYRDGWTL